MACATSRELSDQYVDRVTDVVNVGDEIKVKVILIDDQGRIKLSRKAAMKELGEATPNRSAPPVAAKVARVAAAVAIATTAARAAAVVATAARAVVAAVAAAAARGPRRD